jgi:hypothetical protein
MNAHQLLKQIEMLEVYIRAGIVRYENHAGLCDNVLLPWVVSGIRWRDVFPAWASYNGNCVYPIEGGSTAYIDNGRKHDRRTKYGKLRLSLAKHCLEYVMNELKEVV